MKNLIINADDFGLCGAVTDGIAHSLLLGCVSSTSVLTCDEAELTVASTWQRLLNGCIGVHLQLTQGVPCSPIGLVPSLVTSKERFPDSSSQLLARSKTEILAEWHRQMSRAIGHGFTPTHIDSHHNVHRSPAAFHAYCEIAKYYDLPARTNGLHMTSLLRAAGIRCADLCEFHWFGKHVNEASLIKLVEAAFRQLGDSGSVELACHPGYLDANLRQRSHYTDRRAFELEVLCDPSLPKKLASAGIAVVGRARSNHAEWC